MLIKQFTLLEEKTGTAESSSVGVLRLLNKTFFLYGESVVATAKAYGSCDDSHWVEIGDLTADGKLVINDIYKFVKVAITEYSSGTAYVKLMARE